MLPAANKGPSQSFGFPDVCLTPVLALPVPIPYPNTAAHAQAATFSPIVSVGMIPALNQGSVIASSTGDERGTLHWTTRGPGTFDMGNPIVFVDMLPAINLACPTDGNTGNNEPGMVVAPGAPNVLYTLAPGAADPRPRFVAPVGAGVTLSGEQQAAMQDTLSGGPLDGAAELLDGGVGLLRVRVFSLALPGALHLAVEKLASRGMRALVLDLRGCPGGEWIAFVEAASDWLDPGLLIATLRDDEGDETPCRARGGGACRLPLILLVDGRTASAAELFAGALQAHGRATVVGERTYGKGVAQALFPAQNGAGATLGTVADILLPGGTSITGTGVVPDIEVPGEAAREPATALGRSF
jgi:carboxyl-terminal processing protease